MTITKQNLLDFLHDTFSKESGWSIKDRNERLSNSLDELSSILNEYWLFGKQREYVLSDNEVFEVMNMSNSKSHTDHWFRYNGKKGVDLYEYYLEWSIIDRRDEKINSIINI
jgi:hypothetical protein